MSDPAPPPGFTVDDDASAPASAAPPPPAGFTVDSDSLPAQPTGAVPPLPGDPNDFSHGVVGAVDMATTGVLGAPHAVAKAGEDLYRDVKSQLTGAPKDASPYWADKIPTPTPTPEETNLEQRIAANPYVQSTVRGIKGAVGDVMDPSEAADILTVTTAGAPVAGRFLRAGEAAAGEIAPTASAEDVLARHAASSPQSMGAAAAAPDISKVSAPLRQAITDAGQSGYPLNMDALNRHIDADTLPMPEGTTPAPLRKGQATRDGQQISDEQNMRADPDTQSILSDSIDAQNDTLGQSMGEIRRQATPEVVGRTTPEHAQTAIDAIKTYDNGAVTDMRNAYQTLANANGGAMPIDAQAAVGQIQSGFSKGFLTKTAANNPVISEVMDSLTSGNPMSFEQFENARTNLAAVQRIGGPDAAAAGIVRNALENVPLPAEAQNLKSLADNARTLARNRYAIIEQNPAYEAAVNDNVPKTANGLHAVGAPSPLADTFMDRYFLGNGPNAAKAYVSRIKGVMQADPDFSPAIEASALNKLRDSAKLDQFDTGNFASANFRNTWNGMTQKADVLMQPDTIDNVNHLQRYSDDVSYQPKSSSVNRSNTALTLQRFGATYPSDPTVAGALADYGTDIAAAHAGPLGVIGKTVGKTLFKNAQNAKALVATKAAKLKFAMDATAPGAGISMPSQPVTTRATGGRVDHEALTNRLYQRWKQAQKQADKTTEPLLGVPDATITKALQIAQAGHA